MAPLLRAAIGVACAAGTVGVALGAQPQSPDLASASGDATALLQLQNPPEHPRDFPPGGGLHLDLQLLMDDHVSDCDTVFLTTVLGSRHDPVRGGYIKPDFGYFERFYRSILAIPGGRAKAVILHDFLPENMTSRFTTADGSFSFVKVDISNVDHLLGLNDLRYQLYEEEVKKHPEWDNIFMTDGQDVVVLHNPCALVEQHPEKVFAHSQEGQTLKSYTWMKEKFEQMGGKYYDWYAKAKEDPAMTVMNAGILGGARPVVLKALAKLNAAILDPNLVRRKEGHQLISNMAAFNYVLRQDFAGDIVTGFPLHSKWFEWSNRTDVYFWHK
mmetsp:Transcript_41308/g.115031  ORF Transcript_41308/g.115031 Transcript_41308/m.115031 type:complete len:328 (+) Transcript_41308:61-1044(+)|eukprot:CAMPEP_0176235364 /NCGR_PEP_ID=MMETSP0121_2-20121125/26800_1 /TAXON_ID=160619 /ORGANISM="Kryptoperidinium foliaceum, Strain CCMP 1326" /LENGTH=327 /DNA_ID=CAMNT_0017574783 /DNA_START=62 /DNA_END=1045 /DNA_ORIENTATION=-